MKLSNKKYDIFKIILLVILPALTVFVGDIITEGLSMEIKLCMKE